MDARTPRQRYLARHKALKTARSPWDEHWRELAEYVRPRSPRFFAKADKAGAGRKQHQRIINGTAGRALRILSSGLMAGATSPAQIWHRLTTPDPDLAEYGSVAAWLDLATRRGLWAMARSNIYNVLAGLYPDLALFGTAPIIVEEDPDTILRAYPVPVGEYCLALDDRLRVSTLYRETVLTVEQLVAKFGLEACSRRVRDLYDRGQYDETVEVLHLIEPRRLEGKRQPGPLGMPIRSCWMEMAGDPDAPFLRESGYEEMPVMAPRWEVTGEDVYGSSPGMAALGDIKALQLYERMKALGIEKIVDPPTNIPSALNAAAFSLAPGALNYLPGTAASLKAEPAVVVHPSFIPATVGAIQEHERRINAEFYADLWLMLSQGADDGQKTAREITERHQEKMIQLGPVVQRVEAELLRPLIERVFGLLMRGGYLPDPPPELRGQEIRVEFRSVMTQVQKMIGGQAIQQQAGFVLELAGLKPDVVDKVDLDAMVAGHADALDLEAKYTVPDDKVQAIRKARAKAAQQQAQLEQAAAAAQSAKTLSETDTEGDNALTRLVGPMAAAQAGATR